MRFYSPSFTKNTNISSLRFLGSHNDLSHLYPLDRVSVGFHNRASGVYFDFKVAAKSGVGRHGFCLRRRIFLVDAMDEGSIGVSSLDWGESDGSIGYVFSSSEGEDSDGDVLLQPITDVDLPTTKEHFHPTDDTITVAAHRFMVLGRAQKRRK